MNTCFTPSSSSHCARFHPSSPSVAGNKQQTTVRFFARSCGGTFLRSRRSVPQYRSGGFHSRPVAGRVQPNRSESSAEEDQCG
ncbi:AAEL003300-PA [Aedes aegypti]|uniref:AAEL003300-PA n=1 Tax=Aedes aegypti TaxID=7159 RepID=Q17FU0_AEDAE|nr:AAEL003300-PA [Aedes aegypti]